MEKTTSLRESRRGLLVTVVLVAIVCGTIVLPLVFLTYLAPERLVHLIEKSCNGMVLLISAFSVIDFFHAFMLDIVRRIFAGRKASWRRSHSAKEGNSLESQPLLPVNAGKRRLRFSIVVPAYLPNETSVIRDTLTTLLETIEYDSPYEVILVYNIREEDESEELQALQEELRLLQKSSHRDRKLFVHQCRKSQSKAENVNFALPLCHGDVVAIMDADHRPLSNVLQEVEKVWTPGTVAVQGKCIVRNREVNLLTRFISIEQELVFNVHHQGGSKWRDFAVFGGSNGYWDRETLMELLMDKSALTEDIDASMRALQRGFRIRFASDVISTELVPETLGGLWGQRLRWAQGWFQCSYRHVYPLLACKDTSMRQKLGVMVLLVLREAWYYVLPVSTITTLAIFLRHRLGIGSTTSPFYLVTEYRTTHIALLIFGIVFTLELLVMYAQTPRPKRLPYGWIIVGILFYLPFIHFLVVVGITAQFREISGATEWIVTTRPLAKKHAGRSTVALHPEPQALPIASI